MISVISSVNYYPGSNVWSSKAIAFSSQSLTTSSSLQLQNFKMTVLFKSVFSANY
jgi:hypothetical protein